MDRDQRPHEREMMYCHQCENEWYRDEHGLACPECHSDFTEVIEANNDPREDEQHIPGEPALRPPGSGGAPDPDEDDIDNLRWEQTGPGTYRVRGRYNMDVPLDAQGRPVGQDPGQGGMGQGLMGMVGNLLQGMVGQQQGQGQQPGQRGPNEPPNSPGRAGTPQSPGQRTPGGGTHVRHGQGPGFSYTIATSSNANFGGNLFPRNAHEPQPFQPQPNQLDQMLQQMFMNVGAVPGGPMRGAPGMGQHPFHGHDPFGPNDGFMFGGPGGFANILNMFGPPSGQHGDAVYTQEALDRIMTQLMEQHQSGNAPGPASEAAIKSLPKRAVNENDQGAEGKAECSICMDEVPLGEEVTELPCHHWFHHECVKAWLSEHDTCPHCRQGIMPKEGEGSAANAPRNPGQEPLNDMRSSEFARPGGIPGAFPSPPPQGGGGDGRRASPFAMPGTPGTGQRGDNGQGRNGGGGGGGGMFNRMREAFGGTDAGNNQGGSSPSGDTPHYRYDPRTIPPYFTRVRFRTPQGSFRYTYIPIEHGAIRRPRMRPSAASPSSSAEQNRNRRRSATRWPTPTPSSASGLGSIPAATSSDADLPATPVATRLAREEEALQQERRTTQIAAPEAPVVSRTETRSFPEGLRRRRSTLSSRSGRMVRGLRQRASMASLRPPPQRSKGRRSSAFPWRSARTTLETGFASGLSRSRGWVAGRLASRSAGDSTPVPFEGSGEAPNGVAGAGDGRLNGGRDHGTERRSVVGRRLQRRLSRLVRPRSPWREGYETDVADVAQAVDVFL